MSARGERRLRVPVELCGAGEIELSKEAAVYVARVHRLGEGDAFTAFDPERAVRRRRWWCRWGGGRAVTVRAGELRGRACGRLGR
ncbi:MAG: hypothetical protein R3B70_01010 [Polyangiaceae bacterium]